MALTSEKIIDAIAATLVMADLSDARQRDGFYTEVREAAKWAAAEGDLVLQTMAEEIGVVIDDLIGERTTASEATSLLGELIAVTLEASRKAQPNTSAVLPAEDNRYASDPTVVAEFLGGAVEQLDHADALLSAAATGTHVDVAALFRCVHTLKGMSGFLSLDELARVGHAAEALLDRVRTEDRQMTEAEIEETLAAVDAMRRLVGEVDTPADGVEGKPVARSRNSEYIRVNATRLEGLLDAMGELAVAESELAAAVKATGDPIAVRCLERLERIAREMQGTATALRMVSLKQTFAKMPRIVRDAISRSGKSAELTVTGEQTEIDRAIAETLVDPLVHLLRNAVDHGIEGPTERAILGKPATGRVELRAFHRSGSVFIEIEDDGRGIDRDVLVRKAIERGIEFDHDRPLSLIFEPGFSTAEEITELSGRGVGLDAVASAVSSLRGQLDVSSEAGVGTRFTIRLPLTLAIIDGIVLRSGPERYVIPTHFVERTASVVDAEIVSTAGRGQVLMLSDGPVPVAQITTTMGGSLDHGNVAVVLFDGDERFALLIDEVVGQQSLVIKPLTGPTAQAVGPAGAALMGDGRVALVIDPAGLARAHRRAAAH